MMTPAASRIITPPTAIPAIALVPKTFFLGLAVTVTVMTMVVGSLLELSGPLTQPRP